MARRINYGDTGHRICACWPRVMLGGHSPPHRRAVDTSQPGLTSPKQIGFVPLPLPSPLPLFQLRLRR